MTGEAAMAAKPAKAVVVLMTVLLMVQMALSMAVVTAWAAARADETPTPPEARTGVWDAYPASVISMCPHVPRRPIDFNQLNGVWHVMETGGVRDPHKICQVAFHFEKGENLTLLVMQRSFREGVLETVNVTWIMSDDNVWRNEELPEQPFLFVGWATGRSLLLVCAVNSVEATTDGASAALARDPRLVHDSELAAARLPGRVKTVDRALCPAPD